MSALFENSIILSDLYFGSFIAAIRNTVLIFLVAWTAGMIVAFILALLRSTPFRLLKAFVALYVEYHRNVPLIVQIFLWYFALSLYLPPSVVRLFDFAPPEIVWATVALSLNSAAYMSEDIRSGIRAVHPAQYEAAQSIGLSHFGLMRWVIMPQALRYSVPPLVNQTLILFKATSIASAIGAAEMTYQARFIEAQTFRIYEAFGAVTILYMLGCFAIMSGGAALANRVKLEDK